MSPAWQCAICTFLPPKIILDAPVVLLMTRLVFCLRFELVRGVGGVCGAFPQFCGSETSTDSDELKGWGKGETKPLHTAKTLASAVQLQ